MFSAKLRDFNAAINNFHYLIINTIYFITENKRIFFILFRMKVLQHGTVFGLLNCNRAEARFNTGREPATINVRAGSIPCTSLERSPLCVCWPVSTITA